MEDVPNITMCACLGSLYGEPYCYCEMKRRGLPLNETARAEDKKKLVEAMNRVFDKRKVCDTCNGEGSMRSGSFGANIKCPTCKNPAYVLDYVPDVK